MPMATLRKATAGDAVAIAELIELRRRQYAAYQPVFWRVAPDAVARQVPYLRELLERSDTIALVAEAEGGHLGGALVARIVPSPAVYALSGPTCSIDDYWVADRQAWDTLGRALLAEACRLAREIHGAAQVVVVCAQQDEAKRAMLAGAGLTVASEWWTRPL